MRLVLLGRNKIYKFCFVSLLLDDVYENGPYSIQLRCFVELRVDFGLLWIIYCFDGYYVLLILSYSFCFRNVCGFFVA